MNLSEAYKELELSDGASKDEVKKSFKKLAAKHHPDKGGSEDKFKKINEAYQMCLNPEKHKSSFYDPYVYTTTSSVNFTNKSIYDFINNAFSKQYRNTPPYRTTYDYNNYYAGNSKAPKTTVSIDFAQAVSGCTVEVKFSRKSICDDCMGKGIRVTADKLCSRCDGSGYEIKETYYGEDQDKINYSHNRMCSACNGKGRIEQTKTCGSCNGQGPTLEPHTVSVNIPPGAKSGSIRLPGQGDMLFGYRQDVYIKLLVKPDPGLELVGNDVISNLKISLLEALKGTSKKVRTIKGERTLKIPPKIRHLTSLRVAGLGVKGRGDHIVLVEVEYPEDKIDKIIEVLSDEDILSNTEKELKKDQE